MKGSRPLGAMLGAALALTAGGIAVGFSSHPVGDSSIGVGLAAGADDFAYGHASGTTRQTGAIVRVDAYLFAYQQSGVSTDTQFGPHGYESSGGPRENDVVYASIRVCQPQCSTLSGRIKQASRSVSLDSSYVSYYGRLEGERVSISLSADGDLRAAEHGEHYVEPGYPAIWAGEGVLMHRPMIISEVSVGDRYFRLGAFSHNHGEVYRHTGANLYVENFTRARAAN